MKICKRWLYLTIVLVTCHPLYAAIPFKKVALATSTKSTTTATTTTTSTTTIATPSEETSLHSEGENRAENGTTKNSKLTGIPQIDYIWDPNLPRELRGYNLSSYPFFASVPPEEDIHFKCDGLHDGFYASIEHKCQLYHHCVYGIRHDFLCANFTAFDQKTFICHFVSDVDCEGSQKYWNRNDDLYMATTTTSTTTTTTEPPPTPPRKKLARPLRPLRRPINHRRPIDDDYYYDEEDYEYDDDYYEEIAKRRRKQRPRHRKPLIDYDDDYEDAERSIDIRPRRIYSRDQNRETDIQPDDDYETERRKFERPKIRLKPTPNSERRKINSRKPGSLPSHSNVEDRRNLGEDKPISGRKKVSSVIADDSNEPAEPTPRRSLSNRKRINGRRSSSSTSTVSDTDDVEDDKAHVHETDIEETAITPEQEVPTKVKTTTNSKAVEEFITPKAAPSSVYARPRAPPRIARPVPINEKKKFQYPVQKTAARPYNHESSQEDDLDYYEDENYDDIRRHRGNSRRRPVSETKHDDVEDDELPPPSGRRRKAKPVRTLRKPIVVNKKVITTTAKTTSHIDDEEDYDTDDSYVGRSGHRRRNNYAGRTNNKFEITEDVDFVDDDYEERPLRRPKPNSRKGLRKSSLPPEPEVELDESEEDISEKKPQRSRTSTNKGRRTRPTSGLSRTRSHTPQTISDESNSEQTAEIDYSPSGPGKSLTATSNHRSTAVRIVKRPFLPSRGGSPYLPRGLQPVGIAIKPLDATSTTTTDRNQGAAHINMGSTISGVHLLEHGAPLLRESGPPRTTLPPRSPIPISKPQSELSAPEIPNKATLDELYETDYDVTLNDALNPTLKPLSPHQPLHLQQFQPQLYNYQTNQTSNSKNSNRLYPNDIKQRTIASAPTQAESNRHVTTSAENSTVSRYQQQQPQEQQHPQEQQQPQEHQQQQQLQQPNFYEDYEYY